MSNYFQSGYTTLYHQKCIKDPIYPYSHQHLVLSQFLLNFRCSNKYVVISHMILLCISLMVNFIKHIFMCLFAIHISSSVKCLLCVFCWFSNWIFLTSAFESLHIPDIRLLSDVICKYFIPVCSLVFSSLLWVFHSAIPINWAEFV